MALGRDLAVLLERHLSPMIAQSVMMRALAECRLARDELNEGDLTVLIPRIERGMRLFMEPRDCAALRAELAELTKRHRSFARSESINVSHEHHIGDARLAVRAMCTSAGARTLTTQRAVTIVSELPRNIVSYTSGGAIQLSVDTTLTPAALSILAQDHGNGISNLDEVLSGRYVSRTGLGKGLAGAKKLADAFDINTGPLGTRVKVEVLL